MTDFEKLVYAMRKMQKSYEKTKLPYEKREALALEKKVDGYLGTAYINSLPVTEELL